MPTDADSIDHSADWFLIACDGDLALKLRREIRIGEHTSGDLILCADEADALMSLRVEAGELILAAVALDWTFTDANGNGFQHLRADQQIALHHVVLALPVAGVGLALGSRERRSSSGGVDDAQLSYGAPRVSGGGFGNRFRRRFTLGKQIEQFGPVRHSSRGLSRDGTDSGANEWHDSSDVRHATRHGHAQCPGTRVISTDRKRTR